MKGIKAKAGKIPNAQIKNERPIVVLKGAILSITNEKG